MAKKKDMASRIQKSAQAGQALEDLFKHAQEVLNRQPTGFAPDLPQEQQILENASQEGQTERFINAPIDQVDHNPYNARRIYCADRIHELTASISASGQLVPGVATIRDGRYVLVAGHYRWKALKLAGIDHIKLMVYEGLTDQELYQYSFKENAHRSQQSALDNALAWRDLLSQKIYANETELAEITGLSLPSINKTLQILRLSQPIIDLVSQQPENFGLSSLYELVLLESAAGFKVTLQMAERIGVGSAGRKEVQELRTRYELPKERKRKENSRQYRIRIEDEPVGTIKIWDSGRIALDVVMIDSGERLALIDHLKRHFGLDLAE